ncbi:hypothetical protein HOF92_03125 [bacterium]|jgi:hypothetical protein|nr:hypothetical protein [bacterium]
MIEAMKSRLREHSLEDLELMANRRDYPAYVDDPGVFLAALAEVIREKKSERKVSIEPAFR